MVLYKEFPSLLVGQTQGDDYTINAQSYRFFFTDAQNVRWFKTRLYIESWDEPSATNVTIAWFGGPPLGTTTFTNFTPSLGWNIVSAAINVPQGISDIVQVYWNFLDTNSVIAAPLTMNLQAQLMAATDTSAKIKGVKNIKGITSVEF